MEKFIWTAIAVVIGIWVYAKISDKSTGTKTTERGPAGYPLDAITGVEMSGLNQVGTVGFASGPIDNFRGPEDGAYSDPQGGYSIKY